MQQTGGIKAFFATRPGKALLALVSLGTLVGSFLYLGPFLSIPTLLLFGLALPIYLGWKRIRDLAVVGFVVLLVAAPVATAIDTETVLQPSPVYSSDSTLPYGNGGPVLQNAVSTPFSAVAGSEFTFSVTVNPQFVPKNVSDLLWLELFLSTCPGATGPSSPYCNSGYPYHALNVSLGPAVNTSTVEKFSLQLNTTNIWWWQLGTAYRSATNASNAAIGNFSGNLTWIFLDVPNGYNAIQGPVSGDYGSTYELILFPVTIDMLLYPGSVFFFALLVYLYFKQREARKRGGGPPMPTRETGGGTPLADGTAAPKVTTPERTCPNCQALVYPNETTCWKCGAKLPPVPAAPAS